MSQEQSGPPPGWPAPQPETFGPGKTIPGDPAFDGAFPPGADAPAGAVPATGAGAAPPPDPFGAAPLGPVAGAAVPQTIVDASPTDVGMPPVPPFGDPGPGATAEAPPFAPVVGTGPMVPPSPGFAPAPAPRASGSGPSMVMIGVIAAVVIGGALTTVFWLRSRRSAGEESEKPIPTIDVPAPTSVPADQPTTPAPTDTPPPETPPATPPAATPTGTGKSTATAPPTSTAPPKNTATAPPTSTTPPKGTGTGTTKPPPTSTTTPPPTGTGTTKRRIPRRN